MEFIFMSYESGQIKYLNSIEFCEHSYILSVDSHNITHKTFIASTPDWPKSGLFTRFQYRIGSSTVQNFPLTDTNKDKSDRPKVKEC